MEKKVLGIDPGVARTGYGVVSESRDKTCRRLVSGCITTHKKTPQPERLAEIYRFVESLVEEHWPQVLALEKIYFNKNTRTALSIGEARGVVLLVGSLYGLAVQEYTPLQIKNTVAGHGKADKLQVQKMVRLQLRTEPGFAYDDEADALAVALCHLQHMKWKAGVAGR